MTVHFGNAGDTAVVFHNIAELTLDGGAGNDTFIIQAFALAGSQDDVRGRTDIFGGAGNDLVQYAVNAPVEIDGGGGYNTVEVIGTEFNDDFVIEPDGVFGAGVFVQFVDIQALVVDGAAGDNRFFVQGTSPNFTTTIIGGLGSATVNVNGLTPADGVISNSLLGHSGLIDNFVSSPASSGGDPAYDGLKAAGISANVADVDEPAIVVTPSDPDMQVTQGIASDVSYTVVLTRDPGTGHEVDVTANPPLGLILSTTKGVFGATPAPIKLAFTGGAGGNWQTPQTIYVAAFDNNTTEGPSDGAIQHTVAVSTAGQPNDGDTITFIGASGSFYNATTDTLTADTTTLQVGGANVSSFTDPSINAPLPNGLLGAIISIVDGAGKGQYRYIASSTANTITTDQPWATAPDSTSKFQIRRYQQLAIPNVTVHINDADTPGLILARPDATAQVREYDTGLGLTPAQQATDGFTDTFNVSLTQQPTANVTVNLASSLNPNGASGSQIKFFNSLGNAITSLTFTPGNYGTVQTVTMQILKDGVVEGPYHETVSLTVASGSAPEYLSAGLLSSFVVNVADADSPQVVVVQADGSTNVIESGQIGAAAPYGSAPYVDSYQLVLSKAPTGNVYVDLVAAPTRTSRGDVIVSFQPQITFGGAAVVTDPVTGLQAVEFTPSNWLKPQTVQVTGINNDGVIEGGDVKVFAQQLDLASNIQGPLIVQGGPGSDRSELTSREPIMLPGENNFAPALMPNAGMIIQASDVTSSLGITTGTITIDALQAVEAAGLMDFRGDLIGLPPDTTLQNLAAHIIGMSVQVTQGTGTNKVRFVTGVLDETTPAGLPAGDYYLTLALNKSWETVSTDPDPAAAALFTNTDIPNQASVNVARAQPAGNLFTATLGGTATAGDTVNLSFTTGGTATTIGYVVQSGDTLTTIAAGLAANAEKNAGLISAGLSFAAAGNLLTINTPIGYAVGSSVSSGAKESINIIGRVVNESDTVAVTATGGSFDLTVNGKTTTPIAASSAVLNRSQQGANGAQATATLIGATVGGTATAGDVLTLDITNGGPTTTVGYKVNSGDTTATMAAGLAAAALSAGLPAGFHFSAVGNVLTIAAPAGYTVTESVSGAATESIALTASEIDTLTITATSGTFGLTVNGQQVLFNNLPLAYNISAANLQTAIAAVSGIGAGNVTVTSASAGIYTIAFAPSLGAVTVLADGSGLGATAQDLQKALAALNLPGTAQLDALQQGVTGQASQIDVLTIGSGSGTFNLTVKGTSISGLNYNVDPGTLASAIGAVSGIGANNVTVTGNAGGPFTITFANSLGAVAVSADGSNLGPLDAGHINVFKTVQGNQAIYTVSFLSPNRCRR
jgi:hypothetical protein